MSQHYWEGAPPAAGYFPQPQAYYQRQRSYPKRNNYVERAPKKRSGAKQGLTKKGKIYVNAWNVSKSRGFITVEAFENKKSTRSVSKSGTNYKFITMMFEVFYHKTGNKVLEVANFNMTTGKVHLKKLNMTISTKAPNGGFFGGKSRSNNRR